MNMKLTNKRIFVLFVLVAIYATWYGAPLKSRKDSDHTHKHFIITITPTNTLVREIHAIGVKER